MLYISLNKLSTNVRGYRIQRLPAIFLVAVMFGLLNLYIAHFVLTTFKIVVLDEQINGDTRKVKDPPLRSPAALLNPFRDIKFTTRRNGDAANKKNNSLITRVGGGSNTAKISARTNTTDNLRYSSHQCVAANDHDHPDARFVTRTCKFTNLYYHPQTEQFHYFPSPSEQRALLLDTDEGYKSFIDGMTVSLGNVRRKFSKERNLVPKDDIWHPVVHQYSKDTVEDDRDQQSLNQGALLPKQYAEISEPSNLVFMLYHPFYSFNLGHLLWDDALSLFSMLDIFGLSSVNNNHRHNHEKAAAEDEGKKSVVFPMPFYIQAKGGGDPHYRCDATSTIPAIVDRWNKCMKMYNRVFPSLFRYETREGDILRTGNWLKDMSDVQREDKSTKEDVNIPSVVAASDKYVENAATSNGKSKMKEDTHLNDKKNLNQLPPGTSYVLVSTVLAGTGRLGQMSCDEDCSIGRASQIFSFRRFLLGNILWPNYNKIEEQKHNPAGYVTFSLPAGSSRPKEVSFFDNIIPIAKELYGEEKVRVVDMATLTMKEEVMLAMDTAVLFANHGGGSATSIFLPRDAGVFLYSAGKCKRGSEMWCDMGRNHYDVVFYGSNGYMRPTWIHENERNDTSKIKDLLEMQVKMTLSSWAMN